MARAGLQELPVESTAVGVDLLPPRHQAEKATSILCVSQAARVRAYRVAALDCPIIPWMEWIESTWMIRQGCGSGGLTGSWASAGGVSGAFWITVWQFGQ